MLTPHENDFIDRISRVLEDDGLPRIGGQIFALLMISPSERSLAEIAKALGVSKASASINTRLLEERGIVEKTGRTGERKDYFRIVPDLFARTMEQRLMRWQKFSGIVGEKMKERGLPSAVRARLGHFEKASQQMQLLIRKALRSRAPVNK